MHLLGVGGGIVKNIKIKSEMAFSIKLIFKVIQYFLEIQYANAVCKPANPNLIVPTLKHWSSSISNISTKKIKDYIAMYVTMPHQNGQ